MDKKKFKVSEVQESKNGLKGIHFQCTENDNEIVYQKEDGDSGQFLFGHITGVGGHTIIGEKDLLKFMEELQTDACARQNQCSTFKCGNLCKHFCKGFKHR